MKKNLLNLATISATALFLTCNANAKDFDYKTVLGIGFSQQSNDSSVILNKTGSGTNYSDSSGFDVNASSQKEVFDLSVEGRFKILDKFIISPRIKVPLNDKVENNLRQDSYLNLTSAYEYNNTYSLNQKFSADYILDLKLGYLVNSKTNFYGSVGYTQSKSDINFSYSDSCTSSTSNCNSGNSSSSSNSYSNSFNKELVTYGVGIETEIKNNFLLDINYSFSEKQDYEFSISGTDAFGDNYTRKFSGDYKYNKLSVALKYLF